MINRAYLQLTYLTARKKNQETNRDTLSSWRSKSIFKLGL